MKKRVISWLIELGISLAVFLAVADYRGVFTSQDQAAIYSGLCDAFFVPGVFLFCFGILAFCAYGGAFDIFSYAAKSLKVLFTPFGKGKHPRYFDYKLEKELHRQRPKPRTLILGTVYLLAAGLCLILFNLAIV
ncbi:MAG: DUF3899 domain-containing protein [Clostridia bacterium]|nr:DUF3899 domain-containing protein [Clostridia bacterium]